MTSTDDRLRSNASERLAQAAARSKSAARVALLRPLPRRHDPRHAVDAFLAATLREQVPDAGLEHEAERVEPARDDVGALAVAHVDAASAPQRPGEHRQMRDAVLLAEPAACIDVEELRGPAGPVLQLRGQRGEELQPGRRQLAAEPKLRRRADEERLGLDRVEACQLRPVAALQPVAARRARAPRRSGRRPRPAPARPAAPSAPTPRGARRARRRSAAPASAAPAGTRRDGSRARLRVVGGEHDRRWRELSLGSRPCVSCSSLVAGSPSTARRRPSPGSPPRDAHAACASPPSSSATARPAPAASTPTRP